MNNKIGEDIRRVYGRILTDFGFLDYFRKDIH